MPVPDYFDDVSLTKAYFGKTFEGKMFTSTQSTLCSNILRVFVLFPILSLKHYGFRRYFCKGTPGTNELSMFHTSSYLVFTHNHTHLTAHLRQKF